MIYECNRCGSRDFAVDETVDGHLVLLEVMCRNCGGYQGELITP